MKPVRAVLVAVVIGTLAGCASAPPPGVDPQKAAELNAELGARYMQEGRYRIAMEKLNTALKYNADLPAANHYMGELYRRLNQPDDADRYFRKAIDLAPDDSSTQSNYGVFLCQQKRYDDGEEHLLDALKDPVYPERAEVYDNLGHCMRDKGDLAAADKYYRDALQINPRLPGPLFEMAKLSFDEKNYISARAFLERYRAVARDNPASLWLGIRIERVLGDQNALASYEMSLKNNFPDSPQTKLYLESIKQ